VKSPSQPNRRLEAALRVAADAALVATSFTCVVTLRREGVFGAELRAAPTSLVSGLLWLVPLALALFARHGFYHRGRFYRTRAKLVTVAQAVTIAWLAFAAVATLTGRAPAQPTVDYVAGWLVTLVTVGGARLWMALFRRTQPPAGDVASTRVPDPVSGVRTRVTAASRAPSTDGQRVLVIGGGGYIGSALLPRLLERGHQVRLLDAMVYGTEPIAEILDHPALEVQVGDFRHVDAVVRATRDVDTVVHLGGIVGDPACSIDEALTIDVNLSATRMIADVANALGVRRFVFASTCSVYGAADYVLDERSALQPVSLYARTKLASEHLLQESRYARLDVGILRFSTIHGFSGRIRFDLVVNLLTAQAVRLGEIRVTGGDQWRPFLHVADAAESVLTMLDAPAEAWRGEVFNVGANSQNCTIGDLARLVQQQVPSARILDLPPSGDRRNYRVNFDKIHDRLGFRPRWTIEAGIAQVREYLESGRIENWEDARYSNYKSMLEGRVMLPRRDAEAWEEGYLELATAGAPSGLGARAGAGAYSAQVSSNMRVSV
jgi:nucleoside-diphosphate-sugar epimerase